MANVEKNTNKSDSGMFDRLLAIISYAIVSFLITIVNKWTLTTYKFPSANVLCTSQFIFILLVLYTSQLVGITSRFPPISSKLVKQLFPLPVFYLLNSVSGLGGTKLLNLPMFTALRRFSILFTMIGEAYFLDQKHSATIQACVGCMILGAVIAGWHDRAFSFVGYSYMFANDLFTAANGVTTKKKTEKLSKTPLLFYNALFSFPFLCLWLLLNPAELVTSGQYSGWSDPIFVMLFLTSSVLGCVLQYTIIWCTESNSATTTTVIGCLKNTFVTYIGMAMADFHWDPLNFVGINVSVVASLVYTYFTLRKSSSIQPKTALTPQTATKDSQALFRVTGPDGVATAPISRATNQDLQLTPD